MAAPSSGSSSSSPASGSRSLDWDGLGFKIVAKFGGRYLSIWAGERAEYALGATARERATPGHGGGLYVCRTVEEALAQKIPFRRGGLYLAPRVMLRCLCDGPVVPYASGKVAVSALTPLEEIPLPAGHLHTIQARQRPGHGGMPRPHRPHRPQAPLGPILPAFLAAAEDAGRGEGLGGPALELEEGEALRAMREETEALEAEIEAMERRLGYR